MGIAGGIAATESGVGNLERVVAWSALFAAMLRYATPLLFAALGGLLSERSGVINIGLEGMMLMGAFWGVWGAEVTGSWLLGLLIGMASGVLLALIHAVFSISLRADQIVSGFSMNLLALGITGFFYVNIYGSTGTPDNIPRTPDVHLPLIEDIPFFGDIFGNMNILIWLGLLTVLLLWLLLFRTPSGLRLRSVGENPLAAETAGLSPMRIRYRAVAGSGALAAIGGAYLSIGFVGSFTENMTAGKGYIGLAVMICGRWMPQRRARVRAAVRLLHRARPAAAGVLAVGGDAVPGAPVRDHADRGRRRRRQVDPTGRRRSPARQVVRSRAPAGVRSSVAVRGLSWIVPLLAVGVAACGTSDSERFSLRTPGTDDPGRARDRGQREGAPRQADARRRCR